MPYGTRKSGLRHRLTQMNSASKKVLDELLLPEKIVFRIPLYQRTYAWGKSKNRPKLEGFLGIIRDAFEEQREGAGAGSSSRFIGFMINLLPPRPAGLNSKREMTVVDGQQRITTISLIICALVDRLTEEASKHPPESREARAFATKANDFMRWYLLVDRSGEFVRSNLNYDDLKLIPSNLNKKDYLDVVRGDGASAQGTIGAAYKFIRDSLAEMKKDFFEDQANFEGEVKAVLNNLCVVNLEIENPTEAQEIFENINYKNEPLTPYDLIRNRAFMDMPPELQAQIYNDVWKPMEERYRKAFASTGEDEDEDNIDHETELLFFVRCELARGGEKVSKKQIYQSFLSRFRNRPHLERGDITELAEQSRVYLYLKEIEWCSSNTRSFGEPLPAFFDQMLPHEKKRLVKNLGDLRYLKITSVLPLLMAIANKPGAKPGDLADAAEFFVAFFVRHAFCGGSTQRVSSHFDTLCEKFAKMTMDDVRQVGGMKQWMKSTLGSVYPTDAKVTEWLKVKPVYEEVDGKYIMYVLYELCREPQGSAELDGIDINVFSIDHVMCQTLNDEWREYLERRGNPTQPQYFSKKVHLLGNLALASGSRKPGTKGGKNQVWGDIIYPNKAPEMLGVALATTSEIPATFAPKSSSDTWKAWGYDQIDERTASLTNRILKVWTA